MPTTYAIIKGNQYMDATTYTGTGNVASTVVNAGGFQPDFVWGKARSAVYTNVLYDSVRGTGATKSLYTDDTNAEGFYSAFTNLTSFNSNGFSTGVTSSTNVLNNSGTTFVAWQWKAGAGSNVTNTSGTVTSTVSANTTAGFSICTFNAGSTGNQSFGHGLGVAPKMVIVKDRVTTGAGWVVYHASVTNANQYLLLSNTAAVSSVTGVWGSAVPTSTVVNFGSNLATIANANTVSYCWAEVPGFSAFGSYTGNGSADGPFIYTGFRPKYVMYKTSSVVGNWVVVDSSRDLYNPESNYLIPNTNAVEGSATLMDFLSNGFKLRTAGAGTNGSGETIIYAAFAETPTKYANAR
jgi:hypothetical protein